MSALKMIAAIAVLGLIAGCSTTQTMNGIMSSWEGAHINEAFSQWGYPDEKREFEGRKLYVWNYNESAYIPQTTNTTGSVYGNTVYATSTTSGGYTIQGSCQRILEVNDSSRIVGWKWGGNNCPFGELMQYSNWRKKPSR